MRQKPQVKLGEGQERWKKILSILRRLPQTLDESRFYQSCVDLILNEVIECFHVSILLLSHDGNTLELKAYAGEAFVDHPHTYAQNASKGIMGQVVGSGNTYISNDTDDDPYFQPVLEAHTRSELCIPLRFQDSILGVLNLESLKPEAFIPDLIVPLEILTSSISTLVHMMQLLKRVDQSDHHLRESEERYQRIFNSSPISMLVLGPQGKITDVNSFHLETVDGSHHTRFELLGASILEQDFVRSSGLARTYEGLIAGTPFELESIEITLPHPGSTKTFNIRGVPLIAAEKCFGAVVIHENITRTKQLEHQLAQSQKMESLGTLAGGLAHDFNNILVGVLGYASFIKERFPANSEEANLLTIIEHSAQRANDLVTRLMRFARGHSGDLQPVNINSILEEIIHILKKTLDRKIDIKAHLTPNLHLIKADPTLIHQAILNLCLNSRDAMPNGGELMLETHNVNVVKIEPAQKLQPGKYIQVSVRDTGCGMKTEVQEKIFEPFFTTKPMGKGTGLGLSMVYGIIKNHKGSITVRSKVDEGTTISFLLPATTQVDAPADITHIPRLSELKSLAILVVDDEVNVLALLEAFLNEIGHEVLLALNGKAAIEVLKTEERPIDLVILDMIMPVMSGMETFNKLRQLDPLLPVIMSSGHTFNISDISRLSNEGVVFLQKPYTLDRLRHCIQKVIKKPLSS